MGGIVGRRAAGAIIVLGTLMGALPAVAAPAPTCRVVTDAAGDALIARSAPTSTNDAALDVRSADLATGRRFVTAVIRVAALGTATDAGPRLDQWSLFFTFRGHGFVASAQRALDGSQFYVGGDFPEQTNVPGTTTTVPVQGSFDPAANEVRIVFPRDLIGHTRAGQKISRLVAVTYTGAGTLATQQTGAYAASQVDDTVQPGPSVVIGAASCDASP
jgi:hypothetical protein